MRVLFNVLPRAGHLNASLAVARELAARQHEIGFYCFERAAEITARLRRAGLAVDCLGPSTSPPQPPRVGDPRIAMTRRLQDPKWRRRFLELSFVTATAPQVPALRAAIDAFAPDVLCNDAMADAGAIAAELARVPWVSLSAMMDLAAPHDLAWPFADTLDEILAARSAVASAAGVSLQYWRTNVISPSLNLAFYEPLVPLTHAPPVHFVGPVRLATRGDETAFPWERLDARPLVYVSSGTELAWDPDIVADIEHAIVSAGGQAVIAPCSDDGRPQRDGIVRVDYAPQQALLSRAAVAITHGGTNSVMESLAHGVPLIVIPIDYDQPVTAEHVERAGLGIALDRTAWSTPHCGSAISRLIAEDAPERARCKAMANVLATRDGGRSATDLIVDTFGPIARDGRAG